MLQLAGKNIAFKKPILIGCVVIINLVILLLIFELVYFISYKKRYSGASGIGGALSAGSALYMKHYRNSFGLLSRRHDRILAIGGSTTYGAGVSRDQTWTYLLEKRLNGVLKKEIEVTNLGLQGGNLREQILNVEHMQSARYLREHFVFGISVMGEVDTPGWKDLRPDLLILATQTNDSVSDLYCFALRHYCPLRYFLRFVFLKARMMNRYAAFFYLQKFVYSAMAVDYDGFKKFMASSQNQIKMIKNRMKKNLSDMLELWQPESNVVLIRFPLLFSDEDGSRWDVVARKILGEGFNIQEGPIWREILVLSERIDEEVFSELSREKGVPYCCIFCELKQEPFLERIKYYTDMIHMNEMGHA